MANSRPVPAIASLGPGADAEALDVTLAGTKTSSHLKLLGRRLGRDQKQRQNSQACAVQCFGVSMGHSSDPCRSLAFWFTSQGSQTLFLKIHQKFEGSDH